MFETSRLELFRRRMVRCWHPLGCRAIERGRPPKRGVCGGTPSYTVYQYAKERHYGLWYTIPNHWAKTKSTREISMARKYTVPDMRHHSRIPYFGPGSSSYSLCKAGCVTYSNFSIKWPYGCCLRPKLEPDFLKLSNPKF